MNRRLAHRLLVLYPRTWRERYGPEVANLTDELIAAGDTTPLRAGLDLLTGAAAERRRSLERSPRAALAATAASIATAAGIVLAVAHGHRSGGAVKPYFETHSIGELLLVVTMCWALMEFIQLLRVQQWRAEREEVACIRMVSWWLVAGACAIAANTWLYLAPPIIPATAIRPGAAAFTAGMVIFLAGVALRGWSFKALGRYFTFGVVVSPDQAVVTGGPYRVLRHPAYAGVLLISAGIGVMSANWIGVAAMTLLPLFVVVWRIHIEESALLAALADSYRSYAASHKRLVPLIW